MVRRSSIAAVFVLSSLFANGAQAASWFEVGIPQGTPHARMGHTATLDASRGRVVLFGGIDIDGLRNDVWSLAPAAAATWAPLTPDGTPPSPRWDHTAVYDPIGDRLLVFGGSDDGVPLGDLWALDLADPPRWTRLDPVGVAPAPRLSHTAVFDPEGNRMLVHGGYDGTSLVDDLWELGLDGPPEWRRLEPGSARPIARRDAIAVYDPLRRRMLVHGGNSGVAEFLDDVWALDLTGPPVWTPLIPDPPPPAGAVTHAGAYDSGRDRLLLFGGNYHNEAWALPLGGALVWEPIASVGPLPPGRIDHTLVYEPETEWMLVFGGHTGLVTLADTWALDLSAPLAVSEGGPREAPALTASPNPARDRMMLRATLTAPASTATIQVLDAAGRSLRHWSVTAGSTVTWDLRAASGERVAPGVYFGVLRSGATRVTRRLIAW